MDKHFNFLASQALKWDVKVRFFKKLVLGVSNHNFFGIIFVHGVIVNIRFFVSETTKSINLILKFLVNFQIICKGSER